MYRVERKTKRKQTPEHPSLKNAHVLTTKHQNNSPRRVGGGGETTTSHGPNPSEEERAQGAGWGGNAAGGRQAATTPEGVVPAETDSKPPGGVQGSRFESKTFDSNQTDTMDQHGVKGEAGVFHK